MAGRISHREKDRLLLRLRPRKRLRPPRVPIHRIVSVLEQIRRPFVDEPICMWFPAHKTANHLLHWHAKPAASNGALRSPPRARRRAWLLMQNRKCRLAVSGFAPKGRMTATWQFTARNGARKDPSRRVRCDGATAAQDGRMCLPGPTAWSLRDKTFQKIDATSYIY